MNVQWNFAIMGVPSDKVADEISSEISAMLFAKFNTEIAIEWETFGV